MHLWFHAQFTIQSWTVSNTYIIWMLHYQLIKMQNNKHDLSVRKLPHSSSAVYCLRNGNSGSFDSLINYDTTTKTDILEIKTTVFCIRTKNIQWNMRTIKMVQSAHGFMNSESQISNFHDSFEEIANIRNSWNPVVSSGEK